MKYFIKIVNNNNLVDMFSLNEIHLQGFTKVQSVSKLKIYKILGKISKKEIEYICEKLLVDPIIERYYINKKEYLKNITRINIWFKPLVLDIVAQNVYKAIGYLNMKNYNLEVYSGTQVTIVPKINKKIAEQIIKKFFMNELIQTYEILK